jgi:hypothetical protein
LAVNENQTEVYHLQYEVNESETVHVFSNTSSASIHERSASNA